ncbi:RDD family protein [Aquabacterium sp.]|uniref:RDD family protein n=1 Tax=Aquabacterium sp. TaxID=1872578 RepID=UPI0037839A79
MMRPAKGLAGAEASAPPGVFRRLACFVYEGVLLFGVVMIAGYLYSSLTQQRNAMEGRLGLMAFLFVILAIYFSWFWSRSGQTVAMKAWHLRLLTVQGQPVSQARAFARYVLSWLWFLPALAMVHAAGLNSTAAIFGAMTAGVLAYAALAWLRADRQFWHDVVCGTRLVTWRPPPKAKSS